MEPLKQNLTILQGATFRWPFYWYSDTESVIAITAVNRTYPATFTAASHGLPASQVPAAIFGVGDWINSASTAAKDRVYVKKLATGTFTVDVDGTDGDAYTGSAGRLIYNVPMDLSSGWTARMQIRASIDSTAILAAFTSADGTIVLAADGGITLVLADTVTDALNFTAAVYDLELDNTATGEVTRLAEGKVTLKPQVTRV